MHKDGSRLRIDLQDIKAFDEDLGHCLEQNPAEYLPAVSAFPNSAPFQLSALSTRSDVHGVCGKCVLGCMSFQRLGVGC